jgi:predicted Fe-S protein YdhL (DUF1289 family)
MPEVKADSPCSGVCKLNPSHQYCTGCYRTKSQIAAWSIADDEMKREINNDAKRRKQRMEAIGV